MQLFCKNIDNDKGTRNELAFLSTVRNISIAAVSILLTITCAAFITSILILLF